MPHRKDTIKIVEVETFFKNSTKEALKAIYEVLTAIRITDCRLGLSSFCNAVHKTSEKLLLCLLFPLFRVSNPYNFPGSTLAQRLPAGKDHYRLLNDGGIDWRGVGYRVFGRLKKLLEKRGESAGPTAVDGKEMTAKQIINATKRKKNSKTLRYRYFVKKAELKGTPVLLFFCKRNRNDNWNVLLSTNLGLTFEQAYKIYATRWSIDVYFKEGKQLLNLGGCQSQGFNSQIAAATIVQLQYSILSVAKRFGSYETLGALFRDTKADVVEQTLNERIWTCICQIISELADFLGLDEEKLMTRFIADNQTFTKLINLEPLLQAG